MKKFICKNCNTNFLNYIGNHRKFCCKKCYSEWQEKNTHYENSPRWKGLTKEKLCLFCKKKFIAHDYANKIHKFCSNICGVKWKAMRIKGKNHPLWNSKKRRCKECNKVIYISPSRLKENRGRFCSKKCSDKYRNTSIIRKCKVCNKKIEVERVALKRNYGLFCSRQCKGIYMSGKKHPNWQGGISNEPYSFEFNANLKLMVRKINDFTCKICKKNEEILGFKLRVHHIDYNKRNSNFNNLTPLCKGCHSKTNFNREFWQFYFSQVYKN